ncbi:helix-turn-helix domain-containing protein [Nesterenkonia salmonea]|uniref:Helix-turn-helix domain-containing protein n=1 Tax=Nesterenkonia salmonea TaxID=1804987 RepID=A0A5R9B9H0_9MICC|nr:helix-turn-helix domain-containing protein [Nesterenkonia salmonea]TLP92590.1 helix-turn-helix domain-containing protein [Nesterenkonia salmonea]
MSPGTAGLLRPVIDASPTPMWVIGPDGAVTLVNEAAASVLGYSSEGQLIGRCSHDALHSRRPDGSPYPIHQCPIITTSGTVHRSHSEDFVDRRGRMVHVRWRLTQLRDSDHRLLTFTPDPKGAPRCPGSASVAFDDLVEYVRQACSDPLLTPERLARQAGVSLRTLQAAFREHQTSPAREIRMARLRKGRSLLQDGAGVTDAAFACGFSDPATFSRAYRRAFGYAPAAAKRAA